MSVSAQYVRALCGVGPVLSEPAPATHRTLLRLSVTLGPSMHSDTVCSEIWRDNSVTELDIREYAPKIGIDVSKEPHLLYLARDALNTKLPDYWKPCFSEKHGEWYYFNTVTGESQWEHPVDGWYRRVISQRRSWHDDSADQGGCESEDSDQTICDNLTHIRKSHKGTSKDDACSDSLLSHDQTSIKLPGVEVPLTESLTSSFDLRIDDRLAKLRLDLAAEISENLRKLRLNFSERFQNIERKTHHPSSSDLRLVMMAQQYHEKCLNMELNIMRLRDEMISQMPNKQSLDSILTNFERKDLQRSKSHTSLLSLYESDSCYESSYSESLEHLRRRVDHLELSNTLQKQNNAPPQILPEPDDELLSAKLWLLNRSKQINKEKY